MLKITKFFFEIWRSFDKTNLVIFLHTLYAWQILACRKFFLSKIFFTKMQNMGLKIAIWENLGWHLWAPISDIPSVENSQPPTATSLIHDATGPVPTQ